MAPGLSVGSGAEARERGAFGCPQFSYAANFMKEGIFCQFNWRINLSFIPLLDFLIRIFYKLLLYLKSRTHLNSGKVMM